MIAWRADQAVALGHAHAALADLELAEEALQQSGASPGFVSPRGCIYGLAGHLDGIRAQALALHGEADEAQRNLATVLNTPGGPRQLAIAFTRLGAIRMEADDPEGAAGALLEAHRLARQAGYRLGEERVRGVRARFDPRWAQSGPAVELDERLRLTA